MKGVNYTASPPAEYQCGQCGATGVKLWRDSHTFAKPRLFCVNCAALEEEEDVRCIHTDGKHRDIEFGAMDQIGSLVPAVPTEDDLGYWGYTSVPQEGIDWWLGLPSGVIQKKSRTALDFTVAISILTGMSVWAIVTGLMSLSGFFTFNMFSHLIGVLSFAALSFYYRSRHNRLHSYTYLGAALMAFLAGILMTGDSFPLQNIAGWQVVVGLLVLFATTLAHKQQLVIKEEEIRKRILAILDSDADYNPGVVGVLLELIKGYGEADLAKVETLMIGPSGLWTLYEDRCDQDLAKVHEWLNHPLDRYIEVEDIDKLAGHKTYLRIRAFFKENTMPEEAYSALRNYMHFKYNFHPEKAAPYEENFYQEMGFSIEDLQERQTEIQEIANPGWKKGVPLERRA